VIAAQAVLDWGAPALDIVRDSARLDGLPVAVLASDPVFSGGSWTADACAKIIRFVDMAETFHLPVVYLMDCPGFLIGVEAERSAVIRHGVRAMAALHVEQRTRS
jgi:acetyl-CoA carboxylase carboxyltransferase component